MRNGTGKFLLVLTAFFFAWCGMADYQEYFYKDSKLWELLDGGLVEAGTLLFKDNFENGISNKWKPDGAQNWKVEDGVLSNVNYGGLLSLLETPGNSFLFEVKVKAVASEPGKDGGFTGVNVCGILFTQQPGRWWWQYKKQGAVSAVGSWKEEKIPFDQWYTYRIIRKGGGVFEWFIDGKKICDIVEPEMVGGISLMGWRIKAAYKDVKIYRINEKKDDSNPAGGRINVVRNSSFEDYNDNLPQYWIPNCLRDIPFTYGSMDNFFQSWNLDSKEKYHGQVSLHMGGSKVNGLRSYFCPVQQGKPYTLSVYMKSDSEKAPLLPTI